MVKGEQGNITALREAYIAIYNYLVEHAGHNFNQSNVNFYYVTHLQNHYMDVYDALDDEEKVLINKYIYDRCRELIKDFNGVAYSMGIMDLNQDLDALSDFNQVSSDYFKELSDLYIRLLNSRGVEGIFNRDITGMSADMIRDILLSDYPLFLLTHYKFRQQLPTEFRGEFWLLTNIVQLANENRAEDLARIYNQLRDLNDQFSIFYRLENDMYHNRTIDVNLNARLTYRPLIRTIWSNDLMAQINIEYGVDDGGVSEQI